MPLLAIFAERALTPLEEIRDAVILVDGARIAAIGHRGEIAVPRGAKEFSAAASVTEAEPPEPHVKPTVVVDPLSGLNIKSVFWT